MISSDFIMSSKTGFRSDHKESRRFGFLLKDVTRLYILRFEQHATSLGLTLAQCKALIRLADSQGVSQARLAELAELEPMTLVRILDRMETDGWLERRRDPRDRRVHCLYLTDKAKPLLDNIRRVIDRTWSEALAGVPKRQSELLLELLDTVHTNLTPLDSSAEALVLSRGSAGGRGSERVSEKS